MSTTSRYHIVVKDERKPRIILKKIKEIKIFPKETLNSVGKNIYP